MRFVWSSLVGLGLSVGLAACGGHSMGDLGGRGDGAERAADADEPESADEPDSTSEYPPSPDGGLTYAVYTLDADAVSISWGNTDRSCENPVVDACGYANGTVTLSASQLTPGAVIDLETTAGYMSASGVNEGGTGPDDCWGGGGSLTGELRVVSANFSTRRIEFDTYGTSFDSPSLDGNFVAYQCDAAEPAEETPGPGAVFDVSDAGIRLSWGNVTRTCGDEMNVSCDQAKAEITISASQAQAGQVIDLEDGHALGISSGPNSGGSGPDDCWWGGGTLFGELEILEATATEITFRVSDTDWEDPNVDGIFTASRCE